MSTIRKFALTFILSVIIVGCAPTPATPASSSAPTSMPQATQPALPQEMQIVQPEKRSISVVGEGEVRVAPDFVEFVVGIETESGTVTVAKKTNDTITRKVMEVIEKYAIDKNDFKTSYISIYPQTDYPSYTITGYRVHNSIKLTIRDLTKFEAILTDILDAGANNISGMKFQVTDVEKYEAQAREFALQAAKDKATAMAKVLGQEIGAPLSIQEAVSNNAVTYPSNAMLLATFSPDSSLDSISTVAFGQITIKAVATVEFELK